MFFEGSEKKFELVVNPTVGNLRSQKREFWNHLVERSRAAILSEISCPGLTAFLLSESGLFVWDNRILMITCGKTRLIDSALFLIETFKQENIDFLIYQRKNEYWAKKQSSDFIEDVQKLHERVPGTAMRFGEVHCHHNLLFHMNKKYTPESIDKTYEILMYDISPESTDFFRNQGQKCEVVCDFLKNDFIFNDYVIDSYSFKPYGYSLNAIKNDLYYTLHITPEPEYSYVSLETNDCFEIERTFTHFLELLKPHSFDMISFNGDCLSFPTGYTKKSSFHERLSIGYDVKFTHYFKNSNCIKAPYYFGDLS